MSKKNLNNCNEPTQVNEKDVDPLRGHCKEVKVEKSSGTINKKPFIESQKDVDGPMLSWLEEASQKKLGNGESALCDPQQTGRIVNDHGMETPNRNTVYRYSKSIRGADEAMKKMFSDIMVLDENGKAHQIPIIWATQEKAVAFILQENTRKDEGLVVDRIRLPMLAINASSYSFNQNRYTYHKAIDYLRSSRTNWKPGFTVNEKYERDTVFGVSRGVPVDIGYTLYAWTLYEEDMNQILEQVLTKFSPIAYIRIRGIAWEIGVKLDSITNSVNVEPGDQAIRVFKYEFNFTAESFVSQPLVRKKSVLKTRVELTDHLDENEEINHILTRLEQAVEELKE